MPPALTSEQIRHARDLLTRPEDTVSIARLLGVSRATIYKYVPELPASTWPAVLVDPQDLFLQRGVADRPAGGGRARAA